MHVLATSRERDVSKRSPRTSVCEGLD